MPLKETKPKAKCSSKCKAYAILKKVSTVAAVIAA
jgi:hypothetical protein